MSATLDQVLTKVRDEVLALGLQDVDGNALTVEVRKLPKREEHDPKALIIVYRRSGAPPRRRFASGFDLTVTIAQVVVIYPGNGDINRDDIPIYGSHRSAIVNLFKVKPASAFGLSGLRDVRSDGGAFLTPSLIEQGYDYQTVDTFFEVISTR